MPRFVFLYIGHESGEPDLTRIRATPDLSIVDQAGARLVLVECPEGLARDIMRDLPLWRLAPESSWRILADPHSGGAKPGP